ncbi:MAG: YdcF family protein [Thiohalocapsa sp.]|jgi:uncharacterized SAM-binding protein YcdF (DUF218 family)|uniref:YdcF family protein n=1 Tax=Thiohalocapsa sp. TaxID=2497641 RepID=UPI0025E354FD|nr:YdcF family protein [Thiohalocapsa sp.]MCG6939669.1 YdcF family protein [Thiohalocapsa sp.]
MTAAPARAPLVVVLGAPVTAAGTPGPALQRRLRCALELLRRNPTAWVLATGGVPPGAVSERPEATVIAELLQAHGIAAERILREPTARNTWQNAARSVQLLHATPRAFAPVLLVSDPWHLPRAKLAFHAHALRVRGAGCSVPPDEHPPRLWVLLAHELAGYGAYLLRWLWCMLMRGTRRSPMSG